MDSIKLDLLNEKFYSKLENLGNKNEKLLICFAGYPGSGKTDLAKKVEERFKGIRISRDKFKKIIYSDFKPETIDEAEGLAMEYEDYIFGNLPKEKNGLLILDSGIDRKYEKYKEWSEKNDYRMFVCGLETDRDIAVKRIKENIGAESIDYYMQNMDRWVKEHQDFKNSHECDYQIRNNDPDQEERLFLILRDLIK